MSTQITENNDAAKKLKLSNRRSANPSNSKPSFYRLFCVLKVSYQFELFIETEIRQIYCSSQYIMRRGFIGTEVYEDSYDSDSCSLDLDLLNLKINYPGGDCNKFRNTEISRSKCVNRDRGDNPSISSSQIQVNHPLENYKTGPPLLFRAPQGYSQNSRPSLETIVDRSRSSVRICEERVEKNDFLYPSKKKRSTCSFDVEFEKPVLKPISRFTYRGSEEIRQFPFKETPSGNLKVNSDQVVYETEKLSILVAKPEVTKVKILGTRTTQQSSTMAKTEEDCSKCTAIDTIMSQGGLTTLGSLIGSSPVRANNEAVEYKSKRTSEILDPELNLGRLGYSGGDGISWEKVMLPEKKNLYLELYSRITNYTNADCKVYIDNEEFNCHLLVLQCYSELFDEYIAVKKVELPSDKCSASSFAFIYEWMITGEPSYKELNRDNVLDIFISAKYLKIKDLMEQCWAFIDNVEVFSEDTAFFLYMDAKSKGYEEVQELMLPRIQGFFLMLVSSQDWLELQVEDVKNLLQSNYICVNCEMEVFMSAVRWLKHDWANRDKFKYEVLSCVRFGNIAPWQLVDIKRNPENPDFMELAKDPVICKMIDDGLAFVIIKYWYGQENDDFQHWNSVLGLQEPPARNWSGSDKTYFTYREFLIYLDQYRRNQLMEKNKPRMMTDKKPQEPKASPAVTPKELSHEKLSTPGPTMDDFLKKKPTTFGPTSIIEAPEEVEGEATRGDSDATRGESILSLRKMTKLRYTLRKWPRVPMTENEAALIIQQAFKQYMMRKKSFYGMLSNAPKDIRLLFTDSKNEFFKLNMNRISKSALGPENKIYITDTSLFFAERESILTFGGLDPHASFGTGRNTGKEIFRYVPHQNQWEQVGELPEPRQHHCVAFMKGRVYLVGGADPRDDDVRGKAIVVDTVWSFEPVKRSWFSEGSLNIPRKNFGLIVHRNHLLAIGGQDRQYKTLGSVEMFDSKKGNWTLMAPMQYTRTGLACAKYRGVVWAAGGLSILPKGNRILDVVESYNLETNQWTEITRLRFPRCFFKMFVIYDRLYLVGGAGFETKKDPTTSSIGAIDMWDVKRLKWAHAAEMVIPRHGHSVSFIGTQFLIIGGVTTIYMRALNNAECFCVQRGRWVRGVAPLPLPISGHASVTLPPAMLITR
ncbi:uncharacterized protein LOC123313627 [Coccinella septempunctata]|uniref:uncharacterized protein LOC123313627 n=1 Tax=Coccinella septempunctata TaxID=41139 RepID=UPI001D0980FB|nr:uncharacterized protein LOC123313627 [Coccinella septempunctata]